MDFAKIQIRSRGRLPHLEIQGGIYFVTFRLADSLPRAVLASLKAKSTTGKGKSAGKIEEYLDQGSGACYLRTPHIADLVAGVLQQSDGSSYRLFAWCIMPNHVHAVFQPRPPFSLAKILHSWKSYSAQRVNEVLGRRGPFWQREYYDHLIRDGKQLARAIRYTAENPAKAKLTNWRWVYVSNDWT